MYINLCLIIKNGRLDLVFIMFICMYSQKLKLFLCLLVVSLNLHEVKLCQRLASIHGHFTDTGCEALVNTHQHKTSRLAKKQIMHVPALKMDFNYLNGNVVW